MAVPGTTIVQRDAAPSRTLPTDTGTWFVAGKTAKIPTGGIALVESPTAFVDKFGADVAGSKLGPSVREFFRKGGRRVYVSGFTTATPADSDFIAALSAMTADLGPGNASVPGIVSEAVQTALLDHAETHGRFALIDVEDQADSAAVAVDLAALRAKPNAEHGMSLAPWGTIAGAAPGTTVTVPASALLAGAMARVDATTGPNTPAAGVRGVVSLLGLSQDWRQDDWDAIHTAGGNVIKPVAGEFRIYGYRTLANPATKPLHTMANNVRLDMAIAAKAEAISERFNFAEIDGQGVLLAQFGMELAAMLATYYEAGALFGATPDEAYRVYTDASVNPAEALARGEIRAVLSIRRSPFAEAVVIEIVKTAITEAL